MLTWEYQSPCGRLLLCAQGGRILMCDWMVEGRIERTLRRIGKYHFNDEIVPEDSSLLEKAFSELDEYFAGLRREFDLPLLPLGTDFQISVMKALGKVPYGKTVSYRDMAEAVGLPRAVRAVANAVGANPLSIFIPCHRVVGSDGRLTGYAGGLEAKRYLLDLES